jgi:hypothetical protein
MTLFQEQAKPNNSGTIIPIAGREGFPGNTALSITSKFEIVSQEHIRLTGLRIDIPDVSHFIRVEKMILFLI